MSLNWLGGLRSWMIDFQPVEKMGRGFTLILMTVPSEMGLFLSKSIDIRYSSGVSLAKLSGLLKNAQASSSFSGIQTEWRSWCVFMKNIKVYQYRQFCDSIVCTPNGYLNKV